MSRFLRQEGLVYQNKVEALKIAIIGENQNLKNALQQISEQLGISKFPYPENEADYKIILDKAEYFSESEENNCLRLLFLHDGVKLTDIYDTKGGSPSLIQLPAFAMIGASLALQEVIRRSNCIRRVNIVNKQIKIEYRIDTSGYEGNHSELREFQMAGPDGCFIPFKIMPLEDDSGHIKLVSSLDLSNQDVNEILESTELLDMVQPQQEIQTSVVEFRVPRQTGMVSGSAAIVGSGGLGSWALYAASKGLQNAGCSGAGIELAIFDPDMNVEPHNLNRQILFNQKDLGNPKAPAAAKKIKEILPYSDILFGIQNIGMAELDSIDLKVHNGEEESKIEEIDLGVELSILSPQTINDVFSRSKAIVSCVDNLRTRVILSAISSKVNIPLINAGAAGWSGQLDIIIPPKGCMICRYGEGIARNKKIVSCQEDNEIPVSSIVTSTSIFGAIQGLALLASLSNESDLLQSWPKQLFWGGRSNNISVVPEDSSFPFSTCDTTHEEHQISALQTV